METELAEISSTIRIPSHTIELSGPIDKKSIRGLLDSGSTGNLTSDKIAQAFNLIAQHGVGYEQLILVDGSKMQV